ncbi:MAG: hypothetical protein WD176_10830, partial [Pirellulales bacterium]
VPPGLVMTESPHVVNFITGAAGSAAKRSWGPEQATGAPDSMAGADQSTAWASLSEDGQDEWLELTYAEPVEAVAVLVFENLHPGAVSKVTVRDAERTGLTYVWSSDTRPGGARGVSLIPLDVRLKTKSVRLDIDSKRVKGWNEIDAVGLLDPQGKTHFATGVTASSTYAEQGASRGSAATWAGDHALWVHRAPADTLVSAYISAAGAKRGWSAEQATGPPDVPSPGDNQNAWASRTPDDQAEWLELTYDPPAQGAALLIYETYNPGAIREITCFDASGAKYVTKARASTAGDGVRPLVVLLETPMKIQRVRLEIDSPHVPGWNEIDAVGLVDHTVDKIRWATSARASSTYADLMGGDGSYGFLEVKQPGAGNVLELIRVHQPNVEASQCTRCHQADVHGNATKLPAPGATTAPARKTSTRTVDVPPTPANKAAGTPPDLVARLTELKAQWQHEQAEQAAQRADLQSRTQQLQAALQQLQAKLAETNAKAQAVETTRTVKEKELEAALQLSRAKIRELQRQLELEEKQKQGSPIGPPGARLPAGPGATALPPPLPGGPPATEEAPKRT